MKRVTENEYQPGHSFGNAAEVTQAATRGGAISAMVLVVLLILSGVLASQVKRVLSERRQSRNEMAYLQAERLADAGMLLAMEQLSKDPNWPGTTWELPAGTIDQTNSARVSIVVSISSTASGALTGAGAMTGAGDQVTTEPAVVDDERPLSASDGEAEIRVVALYPAILQTPYQVTRTRRWLNE